MLEARPEVGPGSFKTAANRVGSIEFVHPDAVLGTLERAFVLYRSLDTPFRRAAFMEFVGLGGTPVHGRQRPDGPA